MQQYAVHESIKKTKKKHRCVVKLTRMGARSSLPYLDLIRQIFILLGLNESKSSRILRLPKLKVRIPKSTRQRFQVLCIKFRQFMIAYQGPESIKSTFELGA